MPCGTRLWIVLSVHCLSWVRRTHPVTGIVAVDYRSCRGNAAGGLMDVVLEVAAGSGIGGEWELGDRGRDEVSAPDLLLLAGREGLSCV